MEKKEVNVLKDTGFENFEVTEYPLDEPADRAVIAEVGLCGVCGTDVHITRGRLPMPFPTLLGHEWWGKVEALGKEVDRDYFGKPLEVGDYITTAVGSCGECWFCRNTARTNLCEKMAMIGIWPERVDKPHYLYGAFSESVYIEENIPVVKIDPDYTQEEMTMAEPFDVAARVWKRSMAASTDASYVGEGFDVTKNVTILGSGPIGMSILVTALVYGTENVIVIDPIQERLDKAEKLGAKHTINPEEIDTIEERVKAVKDITYGVGADVVVEATGEVPGFEEAFKLVRRGGTVVEMGHFTNVGDATVNPHLDFCNKDVQVLGSWAHTTYDIKTALGVMRKAKEMDIPFGKIVTETMSLEEMPEGLKRHEAREVPGKIAIKPE